MLVVFRNPKDTVVSYYHFMNKNPVLPKAESWDKFFSDFMSGEGEINSLVLLSSIMLFTFLKIIEYRCLTLTPFSHTVGWGSYFDHALAWEKHMDDPNVLIMTYEELKEVKKILKKKTVYACVLAYQVIINYHTYTRLFQ